jgi:hemoglobin
MRIRMFFVAAIAAIGLMACGHKQPAGGGGSGSGGGGGGGSLYDHLGGKESIAKVVDMFLANVAKDDKINKRFANADLGHLKQMLVEQICDAASGGKECKYSGKDMKAAHTGMNITDEEFGALVGDLKKALDKNNVAQDAQTQLLGALGGMHDDIVGH